MRCSTPGRGFFDILQYHGKDSPVAEETWRERKNNCLGDNDLLFDIAQIKEHQVSKADPGASDGRP